MGYSLPSNTDWVTCSWQCHRNRNPPSGEPGTDYGSSYGSPLYAPANGVVVDKKTSNSDATGRFVTIDADDGRRLRSLHLSEIWVNVGNRVTQGQQIGLTGASGFGSDWGYGSHVHQTLWSTHAYNFCSSCTMDFALYVGTPQPGPTQRVVGPGGANGRGDPSTAHPPTQTLPPGTLANFNGWIRGESVDGNNVWFRGEFSGDFFWSGGFTDTGTHDLADLNPVTPTDPKQRVVLSTASANQRAQATTASPAVGSLAAGTVATMDGWITGETVQGQNVWFREASTQWFSWAGGFTDQGTHDLTDLNTTPVPPSGADRTVVSTAPANIRDLPYTSSPVVGSSSVGMTVRMRAFTHGEDVDGNDVWFQRDADLDWQWSGGFTSQSTDGLTEVDPPTPPDPADEDNPRGLPEETGFVWPLADQALDAPLGHDDCEDPDSPYASRALSGEDPVVPIIDTYLIHWTGTMVDQMDWFSYCNSRSSCPTTYMRRDGWQSQMIRPGAKPATAGPDWNWRTFAVETLADEGDDFTPEQWEAHAQNIALLAEFDGKTLDGIPVEFTIDRDHILGHREATGDTDCPGDAQIEGLDALIVRAQEIYDENNPPVPPDDVLDPEEYPALWTLKGELDRAFEGE